MRTNLQPLAVRVNRNSRGSTSSELVTVSPETLGRHPSRGNRVTWMPLAEPGSAANDRRARLATTLTLTGLTLIAVTLLTPTVGFALVQWFAIILTVAVIAVYLRRQYARAATHRDS